MPTPIIPIKNLSTQDVLYGDRTTTYRWEVLDHPRVRRNLAVNPRPVPAGSTSDWNTRYGFVRTFVGTEAIFTSQASQDSGGRGIDIKANSDIAPSNSGDWVSIPVSAGDTVTLSVQVKSSKALSVYAGLRLHDGTSWVNTLVIGNIVVLTAGVYSTVSVSYTATAAGYLVGTVRAQAGVALVSGDTITATLLLIEPDTLTVNTFFYGLQAPPNYWSGTPHFSTSYQVQAVEKLLGTLDGVSAGKLNWTQYASVKGRGNAEVVDLDTASPGMLRISDLSLASVRLRPVCVIAGLPENPLGSFLVSAATEQWDATGRVWSLELLDRCTVPAQDQVDQAYSVAAGTLILQQIRTILSTCGEYIAINEASTLATSGGMVWEAGASKLKIINDLLDVAGYNSLWVDGYGNFQLTPRVLPADRSITYEVLGVARELRDGDLAIYEPSWTRNRDSFEVPNKVVAVQAAGGTDSPAIIGSWSNTDPKSPYSYTSRGRWITYTLDSVECPSGTSAEILAFLQKRAQTTLVQMSAVQAEVKVRHLPIPIRVSDAMRFSHTKAGIDTRHIVTSLELDTSSLGLMSSTLQEVISL